MSPEDVDLDDSPLEGSNDVGRHLEEDGPTSFSGVELDVPAGHSPHLPAAMLQ